MLVMFILGFFLDFIEIAVVVVPITAPILLADPTANISAVWLGVMIGLNIQTSFLTPPFGFALFYLRGVAPAEVKTLQIYRGVIVFIGLQILALGIVGMNERLANFAPRYFSLTRDTAPPPSQPALQQCFEPLIFTAALDREAQARDAAQSLLALDLGILPDNQATKVREAAETVGASYAQIAAMQAAQAANTDALSRTILVAGQGVAYTDLHRDVRVIERRVQRLEDQMDTLGKDLPFLSNQSDAASQARVIQIEAEIADIESRISALSAQIPDEWDAALSTAQGARSAVDSARNGFRRLDNKYKGLVELLVDMDRAAPLAAFAAPIAEIAGRLDRQDQEALRLELASLRGDISAIGGVSKITSPLSKIDRELKEDAPDTAEIAALFAEMQAAYTAELAWREGANAGLRAPLQAFLDEVQQGVAVPFPPFLSNIGGRLAWCQAAHRDISLRF